MTKYLSGVYQNRLFVHFGNHQESVAKVVVSNPLPFDYSSLLCSFINTLNQSPSFDMYKFSNALIDGADFVKYNEVHVNTV